MESQRPNASELLFLNLAYNRFYDLFDEITSAEFFNNGGWHRFSRIKDIFAVYAEVLNYQPIKFVIDEMKAQRPPMESELASELFKFVRNVIAHFPFFEEWDAVYIQKPVVNWYKDGQTVDRFVRKYLGHGPVKYRVWDGNTKEMSYLSICFPSKYENDTKIFLKDYLTEKEGLKFSLTLMRRVLDTQVEN